MAVNFESLLLPQMFRNCASSTKVDLMRPGDIDDQHDNRLDLTQIVVGSSS